MLNMSGIINLHIFTKKEKKTNKFMPMYCIMKFSNRRPLCKYSDFVQIEFTLFAQRCVLAQQFQISIIESLHQTFCPKLVQLSQFDNAIMLEEKHA
ncbi:hypothetical protein T12_6541 [Trichinella patagoniensis]|uniref:Uncharacterized protein n=1 Tax=Trichinella patagoniensis TaxID=990121 RepID=A0A0V0ZD54_9BILA|nr:hypothetical protein T12_6541 [Trichinella patagoniensis]